ncbi:alcohol dehydrogenase IV [Pisolithus orientalis]|uniref:alcohol dehydrogenase IV n=1 Tax=Pisolithus orientalis TaxID=936130 RepID=UPI002224A914|nr:alcohol dehydrogenase IV [Pisolithus orientalis]KAI6032979.1 alcohol dehydrogenase IV [Pisolithus orientalis]
MSGSLHGTYAYHETLKGVYYGPGCLSTALPQLLSTLGGSKALIVTGKSLREKTNVVTNVESILKGRNAFGGTFSQIGQHAPVQGIVDGTKAFEDVQADIFISVGGGSPIDATKIMVNHLHDTRGKFFSHIAIPTTLSAAEYTSNAGYTDEQGNKVGIASPMIAPSGIILDAELTLATPEKLWLSTGLRALDHAVESLYRPGVAPPLKVLCYAAIGDLFAYLPLAQMDPNNLDMRQRLLIAAWMSLWPMRVEKHSALGLSHSLGHKLGATYGIPHGVTSCLTLAAVVALKAGTATEVDKAALAKALFYLGEPSTGTTVGDVMRLSSMINGLVETLGLRSNLITYGVPREDLPKIARLAIGNTEDPLYPKIVEVLESIYE